MNLHKVQGCGFLPLLICISVCGLLLPAQVMAQSSVKNLENQFDDLLRTHGGKQFFVMPQRTQYNKIPQDPNNRITRAKVELGELLYHETATGTESTDPERAETYSCASCHHVAAGFKAGVPQGIADGGVGFGRRGEGRVLGNQMNASAADGHPNKPDIQPVTSPSTLNVAYQDVMLWNGAFGNGITSINRIEDKALVDNAGPPPIKANQFGLSGVETQVLAGTRVHRLRFDKKDGKPSILQYNRKYQALYKSAFPGGYTGDIPAGSEVTPEALGAAKAIAAYERTLLAVNAPFQKWLRGQRRAMSKRQLQGAIVFFDPDKGNCVACHTGPALSSRPGAGEDEMFHAVGFKDFNVNDPRIHGSVADDVSRGRGGFTNDDADDYKFKIPQLYNLRDAKFYGHGASFTSIKEVIRYKNNAVPQTANMTNLSNDFTKLQLQEQEIDDLTIFLEEALYDGTLNKIVPKRLPSGNCSPAADFQSALDLRCF